MQKILVIEDEKAVRENLLDMLDAEDFHAIGAENGRIGVQLAEEHIPNLIICDIMMPELDGYDVLVALRKNTETATIPFIFLTAKADKADLRQGMALGADDYLTKPFTRNELLQTITTRLSKQEAISKQTQKKLDELRANITLSLPAELRNPINKIIDISEIFINEYDSIEPIEILEKGEDINKYARNLYKLIQNFLILANIQIVATDPERIKALRNHRMSYPQSVITEVVTQKAQQVARESDWKLEVQDATVHISELKLKKILEELIDNAFKFSSAGTPVQVISTQDNNNYILYITDYGRGMTAEQIRKVGAYMQFERQLYEQQGSGLGLTIAKALTELHGGELTIESIPSKQTTVRLVLPC
ncbi:MAG: response regulator [Aphanothece sp. CMT-3BRIN-NPC111]|jgi:CheY-like chemotaxis protein|nr:response regulator [Aphanothece sp. CMT-3BRIN-NPC111]